MPAVPFTVECWVKRAAGSSTRVAIGKVNSFWIGVSSTNANLAQARYGSGGNEVTLLSDVDISDANWHHLALVVTSTGGTFYVNGVQKATSSTTPTAASMFTQGGATNFETMVGVGGFGGATPGSPWSDGKIDDVAIWNFAKYTGNFTAPTAATDPAASGLVALYNFDGSNTVNEATTRTTILPDNANIVYSPYNWTVPTSSVVTTINAGAYCKFTFTGSSLRVNFDISGYPAGGTTASFYPQMFAVLDGNVLPSFTVNAATIEIPVPLDTAQFYQEHTIELYVKATTQTLNRWTAATSTAVKITGFQVDTGRTIKAPSTFDKTVWVVGDSIFEGVLTKRTNITTNSNDVDKNDVMQSAVFQTCRKLGVEFGMCAFGGTGVAQASGGTSVPSFNNNYNLVMSGVSRSFTKQPNLVIMNFGQNDSIGTPSTFITNATTALNNILTACPTAKILIWCLRTVVNPHWLSAVAACKNPGAVTVADTSTAFLQANSADSVHPYGVEHMQNSHPKMLNIARSLLQPPAVRPRAFRWF
jgi:hypothetical protein